jgi:DNA invertase Pin-like site-specific DNA recombinase
MERSGLQQLLEDVEANKVNTIVVYKVDRLTRKMLGTSIQGCTNAMTYLV